MRGACLCTDDVAELFVSCIRWQCSDTPPTTAATAATGTCTATGRTPDLQRHDGSSPAGPVPAGVIITRPLPSGLRLTRRANHGTGSAMLLA